MQSSATPWITSARKTGTPVARDMASGAGDDDGEEDAPPARTPSGLSRGQHGDDDAGIAVAGREVARHLVVHAADLADAGEPGQRAGERRGDEDDAADADAGIARRGRRSRPTARMAKPSVVRLITNQIDGAAISASEHAEMQLRDAGEDRELARRRRIGGEIG